jgi:YggT family protein
VLLFTLVQMIGYLTKIIIVVVIVQFVLSLLIAFNVVNMHNNGVAALWKAVNAIMDPLLRPIRRIMPDTGTIDFSPVVLIVGLKLLMMLLGGIAASAV